MGFPEPPMPQHISKEEQVKDLNLIKIQYTLQKTKRAIMNAQSRDTDYIGHTRHWTKTKKKKEKNTTTDPTKYNAPVMLFI